MALNPPPQLQWDSLPSHLQDLILAHLPPSEHSRLRSVNRSWLSLLSSSHFRNLHRRLHPHLCPSFLVYNHAVKISAFLWPSSGDEAASDALTPPSWHDLSLPGPFVREWVGGTGSLVCVRNHLTSNAFSVGCPYSNQWKTLPNPPRALRLSKLWAMVPHTCRKIPNMYSVILLQLNTPSLFIDVYNSEKNIWATRKVPQGIGIAFSSNAASVGGLVYSIQADSRSVVTYDVQRDVWRTLEAKLPGNLVFQASKEGGLIQVTPQVMQGCKGKVLLVGAAAMCTVASAGSDRAKKCDDDGRGVDEGSAGSYDINIEDTEGRKIINYAVVWELDWFTKEWREMARAPSHMWMQMLEEAMESRKATLTPVKFSGYGELVVAMAMGSQRALRFDLIEEKWAWLDLPGAVNCDLSLCVDPPLC